MDVCPYMSTYTELPIFLSGLLKVAEVSSRFEDVRTFLGAVTKLGFKVISKVRAPQSFVPIFVSCVALFRVMVIRKEALGTDICYLKAQLMGKPWEAF